MFVKNGSSINHFKLRMNRFRLNYSEGTSLTWKSELALTTAFKYRTAHHGFKWKKSVLENNPFAVFTWHI